MPPNPRPPEAQARLSTLNRYLPLWIGLAMVAALGLGRAVPELTDWRPHQGRHGLGSVCTSG